MASASSYFSSYCACRESPSSAVSGETGSTGRREAIQRIERSSTFISSIPKKQSSFEPLAVQLQPSFIVGTQHAAPRHEIYIFATRQLLAVSLFAVSIQVTSFQGRFELKA